MEIKTITLIDHVMGMSDEFMKRAKSVSINVDKVVEVAKEIKKAFDERSSVFWIGYPQWFEPEVRGKKEIDYMLLAYELMAGAVNYQYWYGSAGMRPNDSGATKMYAMLDESFEISGSIHNVGHRTVCEDAAEEFMRQISRHRLPNAEKRMNHVQEILDSMKDGPNLISHLVSDIHKNDLPVEEFIRRVVVNYPGYAGDMFLKRPFLLAMMLHRRVKWFENDIHKVPVPADYQIPKMLRWLGCIEYSKELSEDISNSILIPKGSLTECEIRAASIIICKLLSFKSGRSMCDVDTYLWLNRNKCTDPFHLTVTTDY